MLSNPKTSDIVASFNIRLANTAIPWGAANGAAYLRSVGAGLITKIGLHVSTQSGSISLAVYRGAGTGRSRVPGARLATTGAVACPATGYQEVALDGAVYVTEDDYLAMSCDNTTAQVLGASGNNSSLSAGISFTQASAHALPGTAASLTPSGFRMPQLVGVA